MSIFRFINPGFYIQAAKNTCADLNKQMRAGSAVPIFKVMLATGLIGYSFEYINVGRHHVAEKKAIVAEAMKNHKHH